MKTTILKRMRLNQLYSREELGVFSKRIDFELSYLLETEQIVKHYHGIYSLKDSIISDEQLIGKIIKRDRRSHYLIIPASALTEKLSGLSSNDYICLNHKRADTVDTQRFKIKFQIPTNGFPKTISETFLLIYQLNNSEDPEKLLRRLEQASTAFTSSFRKELKNFATSRVYKLVSNHIEHYEKFMQIASELSSIGAPLIISNNSISISKETSTEDIIARALEIGMTEPRIHNVLPLTLLKNASKIDFAKLKDLTKKNGTYRYTGFILELLRSLGFMEVPSFKPPKYPKKPIILFKEIYGKRGLERLKTNHLDFACSHWGILTDTNIESEKDKIRKWL